MPIRPIDFNSMEHAIIDGFLTQIAERLRIQKTMSLNGLMLDAEDRALMLSQMQKSWGQQSSSHMKHGDTHFLIRHHGPKKMGRFHVVIDRVTR